MRIVFGSCRVAAPHEPPHTLRKDEHPDGREVDALRGLALRMARRRRRRSGRTRCCCSATRSTPTRSTRTSRSELDGDGRSTTYDDYVRLYCASWGEPVIRWLLSTVPSAMIFDDHDVHDDWNTSIEWVTEMRQKALVAPPHRLRLRELLHLPAPREPLAGRARRLEIYEHLRTAEDPTPRLREFAQAGRRGGRGHALELLPRHRPRARGDDRLARRPRARPGQPLDGRPRRVGVDRGARPRGRRAPADRHVAAADHGPGACTGWRPGTRSSPTARGASRPRRSPRSCARSSTSSTGRRSSRPSGACATC